MGAPLPGGKRFISPEIGGVAFMSSSARTIVELNIKHYRRLLASETDAKKRETIAMLLAEEEDKLKRLNSKRNE